jgi:tRNA threonylcarbamoyladenosine biosynthesis protein TsaB
VPVSLLEAMALAAGHQGKVLAAMDAGRGEVYAGECEVRESDCRCVRQQLLSKGEFVAQARGAQVATPVPALAELAGSAHAMSLPNALTIAQLGRRKLRAGETATPEQLEANYIRRTDAEIFAKPSLSC